MGALALKILTLGEMWSGLVSKELEARTTVGAKLCFVIRYFDTVMYNGKLPIFLYLSFLAVRVVFRRSGDVYCLYSVVF
jgi:hypothetical protein